MKYKVLYITNNCHLSIQNSNILISKKQEGNTSVPIDEIAVVVLENSYATLSSAFLSHIATNKIALFSCDESYLPNGIFLPFLQHSRFSYVSHIQLSMSEPLKKQLWQKIVTNKIQNQLQHLTKIGIDTSTIIPYTKQIKSGDSTNIEAIIATYYWGGLFAKSLNYFTRSIDDIRNSTLNYGYAIIRGAIARAVSASGFIPSIGLHHSNNLNAFNLIDDLIEPFRVVVDMEVYNMCEIECISDTTLTKEIKRRLILLLESTVYIDNNKYSLLTAIDTYIDSLKESMTKQDSKYLLKVDMYE